MRGALPWLVSVGVVLVAACGGSAFSNDDKSLGGSAGSGGADGGSGARPGGGGSGGGATTGGVVGAGGVVETGGSIGAVGTGGSGAKGGNPASGGSSPSGGATSKGGTSAQGGSGKGGNAATGGVGKGGTTGTGGVSAKGGSGGVSTAGGVTATGGVPATGGLSSSGSAGVGGAGSAGASSGGVCRLDSDCHLGTDCCSCFAAGPGEPTSLCKAACKQSACAAAGISETEVACVAGRCVLARSCTLTAVACDAVTPTCPAGELPSVLGSCYGPCIAVGECSDVPSCKVCEEAGLTCVTIEALAAPRYHCVSTPPACEKNATCGCMGVCNRPYQCNSLDSKSLTCSCPTC